MTGARTRTVPARLTSALLSAGLLCVSLLAGCGTSDDWDPDAQFAPSLRPAFGARVTDGELMIWTGSPCVGVTRLALVFNLADADSAAETVMRSEQGVTVERLTLGEVPAGLEVESALAPDFNWTSASTLTLVVSGPPATWGGSTRLAEVQEGSATHDEDTYLFQDVGWLDPEQVAARDGKDFLATCTPDPQGS